MKDILTFGSDGVFLVLSMEHNCGPERSLLGGSARKGLNKDVDVIVVD